MRAREGLSKKWISESAPWRHRGASRLEHREAPTGRPARRGGNRQSAQHISHLAQAVALVDTRGLRLCRYIRCDVASMKVTTKPLTAEGRSSVVRDLAVRAAVRGALHGPWVYLITNAPGTRNLLEWARRTGVEKCALASASSVYGRSDRWPYTETGRTDSPLSLYAASKIAAEGLRCPTTICTVSI